tara:strand:+ start:6102 stop:6512 length:411 start_codon:yes stop_codon:yes gene_type:complete
MAISITKVRNAVSLQHDNLRLDVEIDHPKYGWIPYALDPTDADTTIDNAGVLALIGSDFTPYVAPTQAELDAELAAGVRDDRDERLISVDVVAGNSLRWDELTEEKKSEWATYRINLLDVPQQPNFPNTVDWPTKP